MRIIEDHTNPVALSSKTLPTLVFLGPWGKEVNLSMLTLLPYPRLPPIKLTEKFERGL